jgi:preprotein translocase subunit SecD
LILPLKPTPPYSEKMNPRLPVYFVVLTTVAVLLAGCSGTADGNESVAGKPLQLRLVTSMVDGTCTAPTLESDGPASACNAAGTTTYELGKSLGTLTPTSVTLSTDKGSAHSIVLELNAADTSRLGKVSGAAIDKNLAIVLNGRVLSAPLVKAPITSSPLTLAFGTASEAKETAADLKAPTTP